MAEAVIKITAVDNATKTINAVGASFERMAAPLRAIGALGAAAGLQQFTKFVLDAVKALDDLTEAAEGLGVTALQLSELQTSAKQSGLGVDQLDKVLAKFNTRIAEANAGNREAIALFRALGISFSEAGRPRALLDVLGEFSDKFKNFDNNARKAAIGAAFMGEKLGPGAAAFLNQGSEGLRKYSGATDQLFKDAKKLQDQIDELSVAVGRLKNAFLTEAVPAINAFFKVLQENEFKQGWFINMVNLITLLTDELKKAKREIEGIKPITRSGVPLGSLQLTGKQTADAMALREAPAVPDLKAIQDVINAIHEYKQAGLAAYHLLEEQNAKRAMAALDAFNKELQQSIDLTEEFRQESLKASRDTEAADASRERARVDRFNSDLEKLRNSGEELGLVFESAISKLFSGSESFTARDFFKSLARDIEQVILKMLVLGPLMASLKNALAGIIQGTALGDIIIAGGKAGGGPVSAGQPYLVGEKGPEFFVPSVSGTIIPNGGGMGVTIVQNVAIDSRSDIQSIRQAMLIAKNEAVREVGSQVMRRGALSRV